MVTTAYLVKRAILLMVVLNAIYLSVYFLWYDNELSIKDTLLNFSRIQYIYVELEQQEPTINFTQEINKLFAKVEKNVGNVFWLKDTELKDTKVTIKPELFLVNSQDENAWINKNTLYYDIRMTLAVYLNHIKTELLYYQAEGKDPNELTVPFHWVDWVDLTYLNEHELSKPLIDRRTCDWMKHHIERGNHMGLDEMHCYNNDQITANMLRSYGFDNHEQLPGYIMDGFCIKRGKIDTRLAQANSYMMTNLPLPFRLIFLNKNKGTYEVNIDQQSPKTRIIKSNLVYTYLENKGLVTSSGKIPQSLTLDPVKEFQSLKQAIKPTVITKDQDVYGLYAAVHNTDGSISRNLVLPPDSFQYDAESIEQGLKVYDKLVETRPLTFREQSYAESLILSKERNTDTEHVFFRQATLWGHDDDNVDRDPGYHYDWRFFTGTLNGKRHGWTEEELFLRQEVILDRLSRNWFRFAEEKGIVSWIMHGPLLSWYWNGMMFPFDNDLDIQMPARELVRLGELYNQSLVIEDLEEGFGKYLVDIGTYVHNRDISHRENHIDARFLDIDTGLYIDITGLGVTDAVIPENFENDKKWVKISQQDRNDHVYNDRRKHFYKHEQLSPLKYSQIGGVPVYLPNEISNRLMFEYPEGMTNTNYKDWFYVPQISLWVHKDRLMRLFKSNEYKKMTNYDGNVDDKKMFTLVAEMTEEQVLKLLSHDDEVLCEYYLTKDITEIHSKEREYLFKIETKPHSQDNGDEHQEIVVSDRVVSGKALEEYNIFSQDNIKMTKPLRKSLFQFEKIDQPLHHKLM